MNSVKGCKMNFDDMGDEEFFELYQEVIKERAIRMMRRCIRERLNKR